MNLAQLLELSNITDYCILWYGADCADNYIGDSGMLNSVISLDKCKPDSSKKIYLILSGIDKTSCLYRFALKLFKTSTDNQFSWEKVEIPLDEYSGRLVLKKPLGFSFYNSQNTAKDFEIEEIWGKSNSRTVEQFSNYDDVELTFKQLREVVEEHYPDYYRALSTVKGIYMIIDGNTGKLYVGSAYGTDGIWGRWASYVETCHGGNYELKKLYDENGEEYFNKFKYLILQILPVKTSDQEVLNIETKYKKRFLTREFGLNMN